MKDDELLWAIFFAGAMAGNPLSRMEDNIPDADKALQIHKKKWGNPLCLDCGHFCGDHAQSGRCRVSLQTDKTHDRWKKCSCKKFKSDV